MKDYLKDPIIENKHSFKITDVSDMFTNPGKALVVAGVAMLAVVMMTVAQRTMPITNVASTADPSQVVLGEATSIDTYNESVQRDIYIRSAQSLVQGYLTYRIDYVESLDQGTLSDAGISEWRRLISDTKQAFLELRVPQEFQDAHLDVVIAFLDEELELKEDSQTVTIEQSTSRWQKVLAKHAWLN